jgi:hypothetical protein
VPALPRGLLSSDVPTRWANGRASHALAWVAFVLLAVVAVLGFTMFAIWFQRRQRGPVAATGVTGNPGSSETPPEQHFPVPIVGLHGLLAVTTVVLVFLTAVGVGET